MRLYPASPRGLRATLTADLLVLAALVLFAWLGIRVHDAVDELAAIGRGVESAGGSVGAALGRAADGVAGLPLVGDQLADQLRQAGTGARSGATDAGQEGQARVHDLARLLGWLTFAVPALLTLVQYGPRRVAQVRRMGAAARVLEPGHPVSAELLAQRAAFSLPYPVLLRHTRDPFGDLERGEHAALAAAALEEAGLAASRSR